MAEKRTPSGWRGRIAVLPLWARLILLAVVVAIAILLDKVLVLGLLVALGLWPIILLACLGVLVPSWLRRWSVWARAALAILWLALLSFLVWVNLISLPLSGPGALVQVANSIGPHLQGPWLMVLLAIAGLLVLVLTRVRGLAVPLLAVVTALIIGAIVLMVTDEAALKLLGAGLVGQALKVAFVDLSKAYRALYEGALGNPVDILKAIGQWLGGAGIQPLLSTVRGPSDSLVQSVPYIFAGLAVALGFRAGLFNIGAEGQIGIGWMAAVVVGFSFTNLPLWIHLPLAIAGGAVAAGLWASIAGVLKARTGAHEVITTIMLNYISYRLAEWLLCGPLEKTQGTCRTQEIAASAYLPRFLAHPVTVHWGFVLALVAVVVTGWYLFRTTWGFQLRTVGANPNAARYGGINVGRTIITTMFLSGCLAGLAGATQGLAITHNIALGFQAGYGFDSIALALLGKSHPAGVLAASLLFGVLRAGASRMQSVAGIPTEIVQIVQAMVIIFIAAPTIIQQLYRLRRARQDETGVTVFSRGWGR